MESGLDKSLSVWWIGLLDGVLLAFFAYAITLYLHNRQREYLYYAGYVGLYFVYFLAEQLRFGFLFGTDSLFLSNFHWADTPLQLVTIICYVCFFRLFLNLPQEFPHLDRILRYLIAYCWLCIGIDLAWKFSGFSVEVLASVMVFSRIPPTVLALYSLAVIWKTHKTEATYILSGILVMVIGIVCTMLTALKVVPWAAWPLFGGNPNTFLQLGIIGELLFFSLAISYRNKQVTQARMQADIQVEKLRERDRLKDNLYTSITHEFRTPLTVIMGMADRLQSATEEKHLILQNSRKLLQLINQMLELAKLRDGQYKPDYWQGDVIPLLHYLTDAFQSYAQTCSVQLSFYPLVASVCMDHDPDWLERIISNLIGNAIKFTPKGGQIGVRVSINSTQTELQIQVQDSGKGIAPQQIPYIFDWFYQSQTQLSGQGSGIGLALVKEVVQSLNGTIEVNSQPGRGTTFRVCLPIRRMAPLQAANRPVVEKQENSIVERDKTLPLPDSDAPAILIIEDNYDVARYLELSLPEPYQVQLVSDGKTGIAVAQEEIPDLVICDVMMPEMDGFTVCRMLKTDERTSHIPIILLTAKATDQDRLAGLSEGADAYLTKPFNRDELLVRIKNLIALRKILQQQSQRRNQPSQLPVREAGFLKKIDTILESELDNDAFQVVDLCREIGMSRTQLHRKITALTGSAIADYIRIYRLNRSRTFLETENLTVAEAAYRTGFKSPSHYSRAFKQQFGYSPSQKKHK